MSKGRTRRINFRVTEREFELLMATCDVQGFRSLSVFAHSLMLGQSSLTSAPSPAPAITNSSSFDRRLMSLERSMARLVEETSGTHLQGANRDNHHGEAFCASVSCSAFLTRMSIVRVLCSVNHP